MPEERNPFAPTPAPTAPPGSAFPFTPAWAGDIQAGIRPEFDPRGSGYDYASALAHGVQRQPVAGGHMSSRDPQTGQSLKGAGHPTFWMGLEGDKQAGYDTFAGPDERVYSTPKPRGPLLRPPSETELEFFHGNRHVGGYASPDGKIVMNPFSGHSPDERKAIMHNELYRLMTRDETIPRFQGKLTNEQKKTLAANPFYWKADPQAQMDTIMGRLISGDPSGGRPSPEQEDYLRMIHPIFEKYRELAIPAEQE